MCYGTSGDYLKMDSFDFTHGAVALLAKNIFIRATGKRTVLHGVVTNVSSDGFAVRAIETTAVRCVVGGGEISTIAIPKVKTKQEESEKEAEKYLSLLSKKADESLKKIDRMHKQNLKLFRKFEVLNEKAKKYHATIEKYKRGL